MHPDSSHAWIYEKLRLQLYSYHARTENKALTYDLAAWEVMKNDSDYPDHAYCASEAQRSREV